MMGMMSCQEFVEEVTKYREGELSFGRRINFVMHKAMCGHCGVFYKQNVQISNELRKLRSIKMSPEERVAYVQEILEKARTAPEGEDLTHVQAGGKKPDDPDA